MKKICIVSNKKKEDMREKLIKRTLEREKVLVKSPDSSNLDSENTETNEQKEILNESIANEEDFTLDIIAEENIARSSKSPIIEPIAESITESIAEIITKTDSAEKLGVTEKSVEKENNEVKSSAVAVSASEGKGGKDVNAENKKSGEKKRKNVNAENKKSGEKKRKKRKRLTMNKPKRRSIQSNQPANNNGLIDVSAINRTSNSTQTREKKKAEVKARIESSPSEWDTTSDFVSRRHRKSAYSDDENFERRSLNCKTSTQSCKLKRSSCSISKKNKNKFIFGSSSEEDSEIKEQKTTNKKKRFADKHNLRVADADDSVENIETNTEGACTQYVRSGNTQAVDRNDKCSTSMNQCNEKNNSRPRRSTARLNYFEAEVFLDGSSSDSSSTASD